MAFALYDLLVRGEPTETPALGVVPWKVRGPPEAPTHRLLPAVYAACILQVHPDILQHEFTQAKQHLPLELNPETLVEGLAPIAWYAVQLPPRHQVRAPRRARQQRSRHRQQQPLTQHQRQRHQVKG